MRIFQEFPEGIHGFINKNSYQYLDIQMLSKDGNIEEEVCITLTIWVLEWRCCGSDIADQAVNELRQLVKKLYYW